MIYVKNNERNTNMMYNNNQKPLNYRRLIKRKEDVVWLPMRQLSTRDQNYTEIYTYRSSYGLQQWAKPILHSQL